MNSEILKPSEIAELSDREPQSPGDSFKPEEEAPGFKVARQVFERALLGVNQTQETVILT
jgi:hypothetical protein